MTARERLLARARREGVAVEAARQKTLAAAARRQATFLELHEVEGMSIRAIAAELGVSAEVVAEGIRKARAARSSD